MQFDLNHYADAKMEIETCESIESSGMDVQVSQRALGAAVGALGLSNKAVYAEHAGQPNAGVGSGIDGGNYAEGPDLAPNAAPGAAAGQRVSFDLFLFFVLFLVFFLISR